MDKVNFLMAIHCHQPVDNFDHIFEEAYEKSYRPFVETLEKYPGIKLSLHYSGSLLDWIIENRPSFIDKIKTLVSNKRVELLTGGYFEPILSMISEEDRIGQINMLTNKIKKVFDYTPKGIWLAERVWDPELAPFLKRMGINYTVLDDFHITNSGKKNVFGNYSVKDSGGFRVFGALKKLRYTMPFRDPKVTIDYLKDIKNSSLEKTAVFADDCEKFGFWPHTYNWVYKRKWLEKFFEKLEKEENIKTMTFSEALGNSEPIDEIEIPHSSYPEMVEWCGGDFRNFFKKYPESDFMRRRMLYVSREADKIKNDLKESSTFSKVERAKEEIYKAQSNCAYWHGIFGGVYAKSLRHSVYSHIIKAEGVLKGNNKEIESETMNLTDKDSESFIAAQNKYLKLLINPEGAGSLTELDYKPLSHNMINTISRYHEPYHEKLNKKRGIKNFKAKTDEPENLNLYDMLGTKERNLKRFLNYDSYRKVSLLCHVIKPDSSLRDFARAKHKNIGSDFLSGKYSQETKNHDGKITINLKKEGNIDIKGKTSLFRIDKCIVLEKKSEILIKIEAESLSQAKEDIIFGVEFNWSIEDDFFMKEKEIKSAKEIALFDKHRGIKLNHSFEEPIDIWAFPVFTLNESEKGLGKSFQEISLLFHKKVSLREKNKFSISTKIKIST